MDGSKNKVPSVVRPAQDIDEQQRDAMKLHVAGAIIHGISSDRVHLFSVAPNLAGNSALSFTLTWRQMLQNCTLISMH
eukprot:6198007-Pleurochrysis_carterae.AAC.2